MSNGQVFEAFNLASLWELPVLFIIENNKYGMGTSIGRSAAGGELYERATVFGIKGEKVDGMNFFNVSESAIRAREYIKKILSPTLLKWIHIDLEAIQCLILVYTGLKMK